MNGWIIYWGGDAYLSDPLETGRSYLWTGHRDGRKGDLALLYATAPVSALVAQFELTTDGRFSKWAGRFQAHPYSFKVRLVRHLEPPLPLAVLRMHPRLGEWGLVRASMQMPFGRPPRIPPAILPELLRAAGARRSRGG